MKIPLSHSAKVKLSAAVLPWTLELLEKFRKEAGLPTRSAAVSKALAQWARGYAKELAMEKILAKYGKLYQKASKIEEAHAARLFPLVKQTRGSA